MDKSFAALVAREEGIAAQADAEPALLAAGDVLVRVRYSERQLQRRARALRQGANPPPPADDSGSRLRGRSRRIGNRPISRPAIWR